jgi:hypothetical protein
VEVARRYVCVRVTNMEKIDINLFRFDYDLTFAVMLMNADGTVYHRYGGRDHTDAMSHLGMASLVKLMKETLGDHEEYSKKPRPPVAQPRKTIGDIPTWAARPKKPACVHCHMVHEAERSFAQKQNTWSSDDIWLFPLPERVGLAVDAVDQALVTKVADRSAADAAGIKAGDRLVRIGQTSIRSLLDIQWALDRAPKSKATLPVELIRGSDKKSIDVKLADGWKTATALELSWRPSMWGLRPAPGFGGKRLSKEELKKEGLPENSFAFRIGYIVDWGDQAHLGKNVKGAGLRKGDIVVSVQGKSDFVSEMHFQAWFRLTFKAGSKVPVEILRGGRPQTIALPVVE